MEFVREGVLVTGRGPAAEHSNNLPAGLRQGEKRRAKVTFNLKDICGLTFFDHRLFSTRWPGSFFGSFRFVFYAH